MDRMKFVGERMTTTVQSKIPSGVVLEDCLQKVNIGCRK